MLTKWVAHAITNYGTLEGFSSAWLMRQLVTSRVDYGNALLFGLPSSPIAKLQKVMNTAARIVSRIGWRLSNAYSTSCWTFKALHGLAPVYIQERLHPYKPTQSPWSQGCIAADCSSLSQALWGSFLHNRCTYSLEQPPNTTPEFWDSYILLRRNKDSSL